MDKSGRDLFSLLFNEGETVCVSNNEFASHSIPLEQVLSGKVCLVSPNPKVPITNCDSSELILAAINPILGDRKDANVTAFRSYLIEIDTGSIKDQIGTIDHLKMPYSAQVFSGNKSVHTVITLDEDLPDEKVYRSIGAWIFNIVTMADKNCRNPSRSVRIPGAYRSNGKKQQLIRIGKRVSIKDLRTWLNRYYHLMPIPKPKREVPSGDLDLGRLPTWLCDMLNNGIEFKDGRNQTWFRIACHFARAGCSEEQTIGELSKRFAEEHDFKEKEFLAAISSAYKTVYEGK